VTAVVAAAVVIAVPTFVFVLWPLWARRDAAAEVAADATRVELETDKALALRAIRDLELDRESGHLAEDDYAALRLKYETRALAVLRQLDALGPERPRRGGRRAAPDDRPAAAPSPGGAGPWSRQPMFLAAGAVGLVVFGVILGVLVVRFTGPAPPDPMAETGPGPMAAMPPPGAAPGAPGAPGPAGPGGSPRPIPKGMLEGMLQAARASLNAGRMQEAIAAYQAILKREPDNVDALAHFGLILAMAGHADRAIEHFDRALRVDPNYPEALSYSAQVRFEMKQDYPGAIAAWERFAAVVDSAEARKEAQSRIREARSRLAAGPAATAPDKPQAGGGAAPGGTSKP
jgi:cytochrome c-type biogenesis protein CcmH/NrfG